jgi:hypothetical protein
MLLGPHLTEENHREWLVAAAGKSKRELEKLVTTRCPKPDVPSTIRKLPAPSARRKPPELDSGDAGCACKPAASDTPDVGPAGQPVVAYTMPASTTPTSVGWAPRSASSSPAVTRSKVEPLSESTYRVVFTAPESLRQKLQRAQELASHAVSPADLPGLIERALYLLIASEERRRSWAPLRGKERAADGAPPSHPAKADSHPASVAARPDVSGHERGQTAEPSRAQEPSRTQEPSAPQAHVQDPDPGRRVRDQRDQRDQRDESVGSADPSRRPSSSEQREVWGRDGGQCTYVDPEGHRCPCRHFIQIDHIVPYALGGSHAVTNLRLRCAMHNRHWAEEVFGRSKIEAAIARARKD